jgi:hypothetical protein
MALRTPEAAETWFERAFGFLPEEVDHPLVQGIRKLAHKRGLPKHILAVQAYGDMSQEEALAEIIARMAPTSRYVNEVIDFFCAEVGDLPEDGRTVIEDILRRGWHSGIIIQRLKEASTALAEDVDSEAVLRAVNKKCYHLPREVKQHFTRSTGVRANPSPSLPHSTKK